MVHIDYSVDELVAENQRLLTELENAYKKMETILEQSAREKEIAYNELQNKVDTLEQIYTELSNKENLLVHLEKLSSIGQFITEIIHELKNPLMIISAHTEMALMMNPSLEIRDELKQVSKQVTRMSGYLQRFRSMAYKGKEDFKVFNLNQNLYECLSTIDIVKPKGVEIEVDLYSEPLMIFGDPFQTNQIFLNLAKNAFDAIRDHGRLLRVKSAVVSSEWIQSTGEVGEVYCLDRIRWENILSESEKFAFVEFIDNGTGINPDILNDIFQAFFTTKDRSKGTGLGLSISSDIARRHGGNIAVRSEVGQGSRFQVFFPITKEARDEDEYIDDV